MKKILCFVLLSMILLSSTCALTSCHGVRAAAAFSMPESFDTQSDIHITFWYKNDTNKTQVDIYEKAVSDFEALYPNVHITTRPFTDYKEIYNNVITNIQTGTTPNVCITYPDHIATYMQGTNIVVPLDELFADEKYGFGGSELLFDGPDADEMVEKFLSECRIDGAYYAVPYMRSTEACYINADFVEKLGYAVPDVLTWDFIWEVSEAAMAKNEDGTFVVNGQTEMIPFIYKSTDNMMISMLKQLNAGYSDDDGNVLLFNDETEKILYTVAEHVKTGAFSTFNISSYPGNWLNAGQCIFAIDSTAGATWMGAQAMHQDIAAESMVDFTTVVRPIPQYDADNPQMISQGPSICIFNKENPQEVLASWLFTQYLLTNDVQIAYSQTEGYLPVTTKALESAEYLDYLSRAGEDNELYYQTKIDAAKLTLENVNNTFITPVFNGSASLRIAAGQLIENVAKAIRRNQTVNDAYLTDLYDRMTTLYLKVETAQAGTDLGPLPKTSVVLLVVLCVSWSGIVAVALSKYVRGKRREKVPHS